MTRYSVSKTFIQRFTNTVLVAFSISMFGVKELILKYTDPKPYDLSTSVKLSELFVNSHYVIEASTPNLPIVINIGVYYLNASQNIPNI